MPKRRKIITELPENVTYDYVRIGMAASFGDTLKEAAEQVGQAIGTKVSCETIADIIAKEFDSEKLPDKQMVLEWLNNDCKPFFDTAKAVARALRLPEEYFTRFYKNKVSPLYENS